MWKRSAGRLALERNGNPQVGKHHRRDGSRRNPLLQEQRRPDEDQRRVSIEHHALKTDTDKLQPGEVHDGRNIVANKSEPDHRQPLLASQTLGTT